MRAKAAKFVDLYLSGEVPLTIVDNYIDDWHCNKSELELHEYLGLTIDEYQEWICNSGNLKIILDRRQLSNKNHKLDYIVAETFNYQIKQFSQLIYSSGGRDSDGVYWYGLKETENGKEHLITNEERFETLDEAVEKQTEHLCQFEKDIKLLLHCIDRIELDRSCRERQTQNENT